MAEVSVFVFFIFSSFRRGCIVYKQITTKIRKSKTPLEMTLGKTVENRRVKLLFYSPHFLVQCLDFVPQNRGGFKIKNLNRIIYLLFFLFYKFFWILFKHLPVELQQGGDSLFVFGL